MSHSDSIGDASLAEKILAETILPEKDLLEILRIIGSF
jgi:hypothetical protein